MIKELTDIDSFFFWLDIYSGLEASNTGDLIDKSILLFSNVIERKWLLTDIIGMLQPICSMIKIIEMGITSVLTFVNCLQQYLKI